MKTLKLALIGLLFVGAAACTEEKTTERTSETRVVEKETQPNTTKVEVEEKDEPNVKVNVGKDGTKVGVKNDDVDIEVNK